MFDKRVKGMTAPDLNPFVSMGVLNKIFYDKGPCVLHTQASLGATKDQSYRSKTKQYRLLASGLSSLLQTYPSQSQRGVFFVCLSNFLSSAVFPFVSAFKNL